MSKGSQGDMARRKTREKERKRMMDRDRGAPREDEDDWFNGPKRSNGLSTRGKGTPYHKRPLNSDRRPAQSNTKRNHLPFSHSHLMSPAPASAPAKGIAFGKLVLPVDSPIPAKPKKPANPALAMANHAMSRDAPAGKKRLPNSSVGSPVPGSARKQKRRKQDETIGRDWENEWRASGKGGGSVVGWGKEIDREERRAKKEDLRVSGQRYTGGY